MRIIGLLLAIGCLAAWGGCSSPGGGNSGNDNAGNANANHNANSNDNVSTPGLTLDGLWTDGERDVIVVQNGVEVTGTFFEQFVCDFASGPVPPGGHPADEAESDSTFFYFRGDLSGAADVELGDTISGEINICRFGLAEGQPPGNGFHPATLTLAVTDADTLTGTWQVDDDADGTADLQGAIALTRQADDSVRSKPFFTATRASFINSLVRP